MNIIAAIQRYSFNRRLSGALLILLTAIGIGRALQHFYIVDAYETVQFGLWWHIPFNLFMWWTWMLFVPVIYWITVKVDAIASRPLYWLILYMILPVFVLLIREVCASALITHILVGYSNFSALLFRRMFNNIWTWLDLVVYFTMLVGIQTIEYRKKERQNESALLQLQTQLDRSQLNALESQLHPHFLFNTLNTLSTLIVKEDMQEAERMLDLLQSFLKVTIYESGRHEISLREELSFINQYLEIEKVRFKDKLDVQEDIAGDTLSASVPNLLLQPIIENAIYHGIATKTSGGVLRITSKHDDEKLSLCIEDNGSGLSAAAKRKPKEGVGLKITKERLARLFGEHQTFVLENIATGGLRVHISIPFITQ